MKELEKQFKYKGDDFKLFKKSNKGYIYERALNSGKCYYEVFEIKETEILKDFKTKEGSGEFKHRYPKDEDFGKWAWCFSQIKPALEKLESLNK